MTRGKEFDLCKTLKKSNLSKPSKKKYFGLATPRTYFIKLHPIPATTKDQKKCELIIE